MRRCAPLALLFFFATFFAFVGVATASTATVTVGVASGFNSFVWQALIAPPAASGAIGNGRNSAGAVGNGRNPAGAVGNGSTTGD